MRRSYGDRVETIFVYESFSGMIIGNSSMRILLDPLYRRSSFDDLLKFF